MTARVWGTFAPLRVEQSDDLIAVEGGTFRCTFDRSHGLLSSVRIRGREWLAPGVPVPDLWASDAVHPRGREYRAAAGQAALGHASDERVVVRARGSYQDRRGQRLPLEYRIEYDLAVDGVMRVEVEHCGTGRGELRWLTFSSGALRADRVAFVNHSEDLGAGSVRTGGFASQAVPAADGTVLAGGFYPWLQLGDDAGGIDLTVDIADEIAFGYTDSMPYCDGLGTVGTTCEVQRSGARVRWDYYAIRNLCTPLRSGWRRRNGFYLGVVPAKEYDPALADLRVNWVGPHQISPGFVYPTDDEIAAMAAQGINVVLGCAHWRSGEYARPLEPRQTARVLRACHRHGMRLIPYVTFTDLNQRTPAFARHGQEWQIEPVAEFRHLTNLMCYGAEGWREYWKTQVDAALDRFGFDGLYIDFWVGKMACTNHRHGCGHRYARYTLPGLRDMALHAFRRVKERGGFILSNTNMCAAAMINNLVDVRLPGEWVNLEETPQEVVRGYLNSRRLGCNSLLLAGRIPRFTLRSASLALRTQSSITGWRRRDPEERQLYMQYADLLRSFGVSRSQASDIWTEDGVLRASTPDTAVCWYRNRRGCLLVAVDTAGRPGRRGLALAAPARLGLRPGGQYLLFRPDAGVLLEPKPVAGAKLHSVSADLRAWEPLVVHVARALGRPQVLWATFTDGLDESWDGRAGMLTVRLRSAPGTQSTVSVFAGGRQVLAVQQAGSDLGHRTCGDLLTFEATCDEPVLVRWARS